MCPDDGVKVELLAYYFSILFITFPLFSLYRIFLLLTYVHKSKVNSYSISRYPYPILPESPPYNTHTQNI